MRATTTNYSTQPGVTAPEWSVVNNHERVGSLLSPLV
jgi:hypothetical protein